MKLKEVEQMVIEAGLTLVRITRSKHWKARCRRQDGSEFSTSFSTSASDHRTRLNKVAQLRSQAKGQS